MNRQFEKAKILKELHNTGTALILPNIWDPLGALLLENLGYPAIATASASVAFSNGYDDGEIIPLDEVMTRVSQIVKSVRVPVTVDFESGYAHSDGELQDNIAMLLATGAVGLNFEDYDKKACVLYSVSDQCKRIRLIKSAAESMGVPLFINARTDVYLRENMLTPTQKFEEALVRCKAYLDAGADCLFPVGMKNINELEKFVASVKSPVNIIALPGVPPMKTLNEIGISRISLGPGFLKVGIKAMRDLAFKLRHLDGLREIEENDVTSDFLKSLVKKNE